MLHWQHMSPVQKQLRRRLLEVIYRERLSHLGSCLTAMDAIWTIYQHKKPDDRFVLSNGHAGFALYVVLEREKKMDLSALKTFHIHPDRDLDRGIYVSTGSLGQGFPIALGMAMAEPKKNMYCMISDGECAEGSIWEALRISIDQKTRNLKLIVNVNGWAAYMPVSAQRLKKQFEGFGVNVMDVDGHSLPDLASAIQQCEGGVSVVFARTDVEQFSFLKGLDAHYYVMTEDDYQHAVEVLR